MSLVIKVFYRDIHIYFFHRTCVGAKLCFVFVLLCWTAPRHAELCSTAHPFLFTAANQPRFSLFFPSLLFVLLCPSMVLISMYIQRTCAFLFVLFLIPLLFPYIFLLLHSRFYFCFSPSPHVPDSYPQWPHFFSSILPSPLPSPLLLSCSG